MKKILNILKWVWFTLVFAVAVWYAATNYGKLRDSLAEVRLIRIVVSFLLLCLGKVLTADLTFQSIKATILPFTFKDAFSITTITQLGKYLPGGVWHFAGKFGVYKSQGISSGEAARPIILENIWLIASAFLVGLSTLLLSSSPLPCETIPLLCQVRYRIVAIALIFVLWILATYIIERFIFKIHFALSTRVRLWAEQIIIWLVFGLSFHLIFPFSLNSPIALESISAFSLSWIAGYAAFFAPGGIGIRELVMGLLLSAVLPSESITIFASIHRLLWISIEIVLALITMLFFGIPFGMAGGKEVNKGNGDNA